MTDSFSDRELLADPAAPGICAGCVSLLSGRPGDNPPPARMMNIVAVDGLPAEYPDRAGLWMALLNPPADRWVLVFAQSRQKHAWLRAGLSSRSVVLVGTDGGTVTYRPAVHRPSVDAAIRLMGTFSRAEIACGSYSVAKVAAYGATRHLADEAVASAIRGPLLDLVCALAPKQARQMAGGEVVLQESDHDAARLLALHARSSRARSEDGLRFWGAFYRRRVVRFGRMPLPDFVNRIATGIGCALAATATQEAIAWVSTMSADVQQGIETSIRERPTLCVALAFEMIKKERA